MDLFNKKKLQTISENLTTCQNQRKALTEERDSLLQKYSEIISIENELKSINNEIAGIIKEREKLSSEYKEAKKILDELVDETTIYESKLELISYGHFEPIFNYEDSEKYKKELLIIKEQQKDYIKSGKAIICTTEWTVDGSRVEGRKMTNRQMKLTIRAFNNECDALMSKVRWNNIESLKKRMEKSFNLLNKLGEPNHVKIQWDYFFLKKNELNLTHEYKLKIQQEKEERRENMAMIREEEKAQRDFEKAIKNAEKEEALYQKAIDKVKEDLGLVSGEELNKLQKQILNLEENLRLAHEQKERALSMAQQTRCGYVYIISNIGSFGKDIYKIGLTRRLEPMDRVRELGDSSVPFTFDVHAMIYSDDAPALEYKLHQKFKNKSVNLINFRKEFFNVSLEEIKQIVNEEMDNEIEFVELTEAQQYRESIAIREEISKENHINSNTNKFPDSLFGGLYNQS